MLYLLLPLEQMDFSASSVNQGVAGFPASLLFWIKLETKVPCLYDLCNDGLLNMSALTPTLKHWFLQTNDSNDCF